MKILDARVKWYERFANGPNFQVLVDEIPSLQDLRFQQKGSLYFSHLGGYVRFFAYSGPGDGYGGHVFNIIMEDGEQRNLAGPWSSRPGVMNDYFTPNCVDVSITDKAEVWKRGHTFFAGNMSIDLAIEAAKICGVNLLKTISPSGETKYEPSISMQRVKKPNEDGGFRSNEVVEVIYASRDN